MNAQRKEPEIETWLIFYSVKADPKNLLRYGQVYKYGSIKELIDKARKIPGCQKVVTAHYVLERVVTET